MLVKLAEVDLAKPLQPLTVEQRYDHLAVIVSWGYQPLGLVRLACQPGLRTFKAEQLKQAIVETLGHPLWSQAVAGNLAEQEGYPDHPLPAISVVVCTRDRPLLLAGCLQNLGRLDYPTYEVVVVDNCSRDPAVAQVVAQSGFRYVREDRPGLDWTRNRGFQEARYDIVAYIDDDALAAPGWLRGVARGFAQAEVMAVTGLVLPAEIETPAQQDFERYGGMSKGFIGYTIRRAELSGQALLWANHWGVGANMAFGRRLFEAIGGFDIALDVGTPTCGAGDLEFFYRLVAAGHTLRYEPLALVRHIHRREAVALDQQIYNNGRSFAAYLLTISRNYPEQRCAVLWFALRRWILTWLIWRLLSSLLKRDRRTFRFAWTETKGCWSAPGAYRAAQQRARQQLKT